MRQVLAVVEEVAPRTEEAIVLSCSREPILKRIGNPQNHVTNF